jgi:hypothetical protein
MKAADRNAGVFATEIMRVLTPRGVTLVRGGVVDDVNGNGE